MTQVHHLLSRRLPHLLMLVALLWMTPVQAERGIAWQQLSAQEQALLQQHAPPRWGKYSSDQQQQLRDNAQRYLNMPPGQRQKVEKKRREYQQMSPEERRRLRDTYRRANP